MDNTEAKEGYMASLNIVTAQLHKEVSIIPLHRQTLVDSGCRLCKDATVITPELSMNMDDQDPLNHPKALRLFLPVVLSLETCQRGSGDP